MALKSLEDALLMELQDVLQAERQILKELPKMTKKTTNQELSKAFEVHLVEMQGQIGRLEKVFEILGRPAKGKKCEGMPGIIDEGEDLLQEKVDPDVLDALIIEQAQLRNRLLWDVVHLSQYSGTSGDRSFLA